jgi:hypothetical protein
LYRGVQRAVQRTAHRVKAMHTLDDVADLGRRGEPHRDVDPPDDEHVVLGLHFADHVGRQLAAARIDLTRFQRASKGAHHSTGGRRDDVVDCGGMRFAERRGIDLVMFGNGTVRTEDHWLRFTGQIRQAKRALVTL